ncbi:lipoxygenase 1 [Phlyctema vagabunda]|uniref:Manganese lipoxygenase n=1 Tax=Phlyctema vagabunda TaxID=108571 RepID=A0ABR4PHG1_9HELO
MSIAVRPTHNGIGNDINKAPKTVEDILNSNINHRVENDPMVVWDKGVFLNELHRQHIVLQTGSDGGINGGIAAPKGLKQGTYHGTQMALTEIYSLIEEAAASHFDTRGFEPIIPQRRALDQKRELYQWSDGTDGFPPHLNTLPPDETEAAVGQIFDLKQQGFIGAVGSIMSFIIPETISAQGTPFKGPTIADCEKYNLDRPNKNTSIMGGENLGNKDDWYSDFRFAHQHLSGVNPSTIETAPRAKVDEYIKEADRQHLDEMKKLLSEGKDLLIQDYSYFRKATGVSDDEVFQNLVMGTGQEPGSKEQTFRYGCASVIIFQLHSDGRLHPLAITLDYRGSLDKSITTFNRRLSPDAKSDIQEKDDWPWRYAKTCAQTSDWTRHEIAVHLVETHMVEEAIIVATNRTIPEDELLYEILSPHWFRTLALNAAARATLVPAVIGRLSGLGPVYDPRNAKTSRAYGLVKYSFENFNFQDKYIPADLKKRGFDLDAETGDKFSNYPYATDMLMLWAVIREFVKSVLDTKYKSDEDVKRDEWIPNWCKEIQTNGGIPTFPTIETMDQLIDAVTMCIHTASPQHTAVNYLQDYYYSFVPAKPPALCTPLPKDLQELQGYTEKELTNALPIGTEGPKWKDWLLAAQLPELLSYKVETRYNLITYAKSLYNVNKGRTNFENSKFDSKAIAGAAARFYSHLKDCEIAFQLVSDMQTENSIEYKVLQPDSTAVSILI